jgi:hypothetical protein
MEPFQPKNEPPLSQLADPAQCNRSRAARSSFIGWNAPESRVVLYPTPVITEAFSYLMSSSLTAQDGVT